MKSFKCDKSGVVLISLEEVNSRVSAVAQAGLELRLIEMKYFGDCVKNVKNKYGRRILSTLLISFVVAIVGGVVYCQLIHCA